VIAVQKNKIKQNKKSGWKLASGDSGAEPQKNTIKIKKIKNQAGNSLLVIAAQNNQKEICKALHNRGADLDTQASITKASQKHHKSITKASQKHPSLGHVSVSLEWKVIRTCE
jgi:hypothetical protein